MNENQPGKDFDIKRNADGPPQNSRPIIVGHHPVAPDPMVHRIKTPAPSSADNPSEPIKVPVMEHNEGPINTPPSGKKIIQPLSNPDTINADAELVVPAKPSDNAETSPPSSIAPQSEMPQPQIAQSGAAPGADNEPKMLVPETDAQDIPNQIPEDLKVHLPAGAAAHKSKKSTWLILVVLAVVAGLGVAYFFLAK